MIEVCRYAIISSWDCVLPRNGKPMKTIIEMNHHWYFCHWMSLTKPNHSTNAMLPEPGLSKKGQRLAWKYSRGAAGPAWRKGPLHLNHLVRRQLCHNACNLKCGVGNFKLKFPQYLTLLYICFNVYILSVTVIVDRLWIWQHMTAVQTSKRLASKEASTEIIRDAKADWQDACQTVVEGQRCEFIHDLASATERNSVPWRISV